MHTAHSTFSLAGLTLHRITFDPATFTDADLLWLPITPSSLTPDVNARLTIWQDASPPRTPCLTTPFRHRPQREPLWPDGISGSITHSGTEAMAVVAPYPALIGIDSEAILAENEAREIKDGIIDVREERVLSHSGYPFALALTLVFSAKESLFKALFRRCRLTWSLTARASPCSTIRRLRWR